MSSNNKKVYPERSRRVFVAMSGGVDSSVAAALLKEEGYEVHGAHMLCADFDLSKKDNEIEHPRFVRRIGTGMCKQAQDDCRDAMSVAARLEIPFYTFDFRKEYRTAVYDYMVREYEAGRTPNPDVMCNKTIKFGIFLKRALEMGFDFIATGHYVRRDEITRLARVLTLSSGAPTPTSNPSDFVSPQAVQFRHSLFAAKDLSKDQSYFLWTLTQDQLRHSLFPVGNLLKTEVREIAKKFRLPTAEKKDSQGLCFVGKVDFAEFIREALPKNPGPVVDASGKKIGEHDGAHFYTLGQRHGLNIGGFPEPLYIAEKRAGTNTLVVANGDRDPILYKKELIAENVHWISGEVPALPLVCIARIRYRQLLQKCALYSDGKVIFDTPQRAISSGQSVVFYASSEASAKEGGNFCRMLGGGI